MSKYLKSLFFYACDGERDHRVVLAPMLWSLSTTDRSMLLMATLVETFTLS